MVASRPEHLDLAVNIVHQAVQMEVEDHLAERVVHHVRHLTSARGFGKVAGRHEDPLAKARSMGVRHVVHGQRKTSGLPDARVIEVEPVGDSHGGNRTGSTGGAI